MAEDPILELTADLVHEVLPNARMPQHHGVLLLLKLGRAQLIRLHVVVWWRQFGSLLNEWFLWWLLGQLI